MSHALENTADLQLSRRQSLTPSTHSVSHKMSCLMKLHPVEQPAGCSHSNPTDNLCRSVEINMTNT